MTSLLFHHARVLTMDPARPRADALAVRDGRVVDPGALEDGAQRIDCAGGVLVPAFIDAHCHLLAYAAALRSIDCSAARSIAEVQDAVRARAERTPPGRWLRATGYEETQLAEGRHPDRHDLDAAAPAHPVRLLHGSGHASVLNSLALREAGIGVATEEPPGGRLDRELPSGEPSGLLLGMERLLDGALPPLPYGELAAAVREAAQRFLRAGIVCIQDATHTNGPAEWALFARLIEEGALPLDVVLMEGVEHLGALPERAAGGRLRRGPVKLMLDEAEGGFAPDEAELRRAVAAVHQAGRQVAVHAVVEGAVAAAAAAIGQALAARPRPDHRHRIEHCGVLPDGLAAELAALGVTVVSQPSFVYERGDRYLALVPEAQRDRLYAFRALAGAGVALAASSDAPVAPPEPLASIAAAQERRTRSGRPLGPSEAVGREEALVWWTSGAARAAFLEAERGALLPGRRADVALLAPAALDLAPAELRGGGVTRLWREGVEVDLASARIA